MKAWLRALIVIGGGSLLLGSDCMFGRPIVDEQSRYYPSDGVISCTGTRCADLPSYELALPEPLADSPCSHELPTTDLQAAARAGSPVTGQRFVLASERPLDALLNTIDLRDACLVLAGPIRLTLGSGSRLSNVTVLLGLTPLDSDAGTGSSSRATPNIYFGHAQLDRVSLRAIEEGEPSGAAQIEFSSCTQCETRIDSLNVTQSQLQNSRLAADSLTVVGGAFDAVELAFDYGLLAGVLANDLRTTACNTLSLVGATIAGRASKIGPCDCSSAAEANDGGVASETSPADGGEPPADEEAGTADAGAAFDANVVPPDADPLDAEDVDREAPDAATADATEADAAERDGGAIDEACNGVTATQTTFYGGMVDGRVRAENSSFRSVLFARNAQTSLDVFGTNIELSVACAHPIDVRLDKTSGIGCTSCDTEGTAAACALDRAPELIVNKCESFSGHLPACEPPLPTRITSAIPRPPKLGQ